LHLSNILKMTNVLIDKYDMNNEKRGNALIINIKKYVNDAHTEREWSIRDVQNLTNTLTNLDFDIKVCQNLTKEQLESVMQEQATLNHRNSDCFLCVIMSHGNQEKIVASDNKEISFEQIMAPIKTCDSLVNKPKLFFIQACRGENDAEFASSKQRSSSAQSISSNRGGDTHNNMSDHGINTTPNDSSQNNSKPQTTKIENESDILVYYSTLPNHLSFSKEISEGTIFIKSLCDVFDTYAYKNLPHNNLPLSQMITKINESVMSQGVQIADPVFRMKREVYFMPKNVNIIIAIITFLLPSSSSDL
jgi:caspase 7